MSTVEDGQNWQYLAALSKCRRPAITSSIKQTFKQRPNSTSKNFQKKISSKDFAQLLFTNSIDVKIRVNKAETLLAIFSVNWVDSKAKYAENSSQHSELEVKLIFQSRSTWEEFLLGFSTATNFM